MREPLEMVTASLMQNMVQIRKENIYFVTKLLFESFGKRYLGALGVESPYRVAISPFRYMSLINSPTSRSNLCNVCGN